MKKNSLLIPTIFFSFFYFSAKAYIRIPDCNELNDFLIAGEDHQFVPAIAKTEGATVVVYNSKVPHPNAVRMGFTSAAIPNLFNKAGLAALPFRTDDWELK